MPAKSCEQGGDRGGRGALAGAEQACGVPERAQRRGEAQGARRAQARAVSRTTIAASLGAFPVNVAVMVLRTGTRAR